jgi:transcriptional regulator with XRE-family HTH domain
MAGTGQDHDVTTEAIAWTARTGEHLRALRRKAGLRRSDLAGRLGVSDETIRLWEKGSVQPSADRLARLIALMALEADGWSALVDDASPHDLPPLARRLRHERELRGVTQAEAVRSIGVPQATYAGWETGRTTPGSSAHAVLASFLGITEQDVATLCASPFVVDTAGWSPFGQFVGARRQELRLTRAELADQVGVTARTIAAWELGYRVPGSLHLAQIATALEVDPASLAAALPSRWTDGTLGDVIVGRLRELGLRAADLARLVGTTEATVSRWVNGRSRPGTRNLERLAEALQLPYSRLADAAGPVV